MSNDPGSDEGVPDEVNAWLADLADERGLSERELVERLLAGDGADAPVGPAADVEDLLDRVADLEASVSDLEDDLDDQVQDVRERVIQVKREADAKALRDHDHPGLEEAIERLGGNLDALGNDFVDIDADVDRMEDRIDEVDERMDLGFENYEDVLSYLVDVTDDLGRKVDTLARTLLEVRERTARLETADARRAGVDRLREPAARHGVTEAKCEDCGNAVQLGVMTAPRCPHCEASFARLDPSRGFFRASVLRTGRRPALEGDVDHDAPELDAIVSEEVEAPPEVGVDATGPGEAVTDAAPASAGRDGTEGEDGSDATDGDERAETRAADARGNPTGAGGAADRAVDAVPGIGSAYAERLGAAGVDTVGALALSDADRLAERTGVAHGRVETWIGRAREMVEER